MVVLDLKYVRSFRPNGGMRAVAHHEAGHAVASWRKGMDPGRVVLLAPPSDLSRPWVRGQHRSGDGPRPGDSPVMVRAHAVVLFAGQAAEMEWIRRYAYPENRSRAETLATVGATEDERRAAELLQALNSENAGSELRSEAAELVASNWAVIERIAMELTKNGARGLGVEVEVQAFLPAA
jgi:hypothetical protein